MKPIHGVHIATRLLGGYPIVLLELCRVVVVVAPIRRSIQSVHCRSPSAVVASMERLGQLRREWNFCVLLLDIIWIWRNNRFAITLHHFYFSDKEDSKIKHVINMKRLSDEQHGRDITAGNHTSEEEMIGTSFKGHGISLSC